MRNLSHIESLSNDITKNLICENLGFDEILEKSIQNMSTCQQSASYCNLGMRYEHFYALMTP